MITHDLDLAAKLPRCVTMRDGQLISDRSQAVDA